jgi:hypothetical protein
MGCPWFNFEWPRNIDQTIVSIVYRNSQCHWSPECATQTSSRPIPFRFGIGSKGGIRFFIPIWNSSAHPFHSWAQQRTRPGAKAAAIKKSFRQLALRFHPDKNRDSRDLKADVAFEAFFLRNFGCSDSWRLRNPLLFYFMLSYCRCFTPCSCHTYSHVVTLLSLLAEWECDPIQSEGISRRLADDWPSQEWFVVKIHVGFGLVAANHFPISELHQRSLERFTPCQPRLRSQLWLSIRVY